MLALVIQEYGWSFNHLLFSLPPFYVIILYCTSLRFPSVNLFQLISLWDPTMNHTLSLIYFIFVYRKSTYFYVLILYFCTLIYASSAVCAFLWVFKVLLSIKLFHQQIRILWFPSLLFVPILYLLYWFG